MRWTLRQKGWRALLIRMALLTAVWLVVAFVFATEFYLSARGMPVRISWSEAAAGASRDWFPWLLLSPVAVVLAGRFRFDRGAWRRSLVVHFAACCCFSIAYEGLLIVAYPAPLKGGIGMVTTSAGLPPGLGAFGVIRGGVGSAPPLRLPAGSNFALVESGGSFPPGPGGLSGSVSSNGTFVFSVEGRPPFVPRTNGVTVGFRTFPPVNPWTRLLHMAVLKTQFTVPIYLCIVCVCWVINHFQEAGERERRTLELETRLTQANLLALKMQLQPHFLFNTLNAISSLIHENPKAADDMVGSLSQFLRTTLEVSSENEVPLRKELDFVDRYLEIQQTRFGDRLRIHREVEAGIMDALVPPLILQPLAENAIRYGIEPREAGGTVSIRAARTGSALRLEVSDDGAGFKGGELLRAGNGIGLSNTKTRLQELYGDRHQFKLTANQPAGACVKIEIPVRFPPSGASNGA